MALDKYEISDYIKYIKRNFVLCSIVFRSLFWAAPRGLERLVYKVFDRLKAVNVFVAGIRLVA
jgi:hypothetical protein